MTGPAPSPVWVYAPDLMDRSRLLAAHPTAVVVSRPQALLDAPPGTTALIDVSRAGVLDVLSHIGHIHTVGYASHVDDALVERARAAGCDEVLARSVFFRRWGSATS